ncbi:MAG: hypothetical protein KA215_04730 [Flavobacterium sp.]|nr:hypothetical protein [Bacteroidota bacterium]MBK9414344.1 hypothetical protein [Bacteroidota bacterium]MBP6584955.1 hypothetical protein [Flavobacterium sp.]MBP9888592.1 hypothetical protein [Leptospiraceae bacterium]
MERSILYVIIVILIYSCKDKSTAVENFNAGIESYNDSSFTTALENFTKASKKDTKNANAFFYRALSEARLQKHKEALISFQKSIELDSVLYQALVERAKLKIKLGDFASACNDCDKAKMIKIDFPEIYKTKAIAFENLNDPSNAIIAYEYAIKYGQKDGETFYNLGVLRLNYGNRDSACALLSKAGELGFMEAYEMIKRNCNPSYKEVLNENSDLDNFKKKDSSEVNNILTEITEENSNANAKKSARENSTNTITSFGSDIPNIKIGNVFTKTSDYEIKGISSKTNEHYYQYTKPIKRLVYGHSVDYIVVTTKNNVIIEYIYFLFPNSGDIGVPKEMIVRFNTETGFALGKNGDSYAAKIDNFFIMITRVDDINLGGDRIMIKTKNEN